MNIGATVAAADTGEGSNGVSVAVTVTDERPETIDLVLISTHAIQEIS